MKDRISLAMEGVGAGLFWVLGGFTLLILTAPFFWMGEALSDLRWHLGFTALLPALPGVLLLPRRRLTFVGLFAVGVLNVMPGLRVYVPPDGELFEAGVELTVVEVHWGTAPTGALELYIAQETPDLLVVTGLDQIARETLKERLVAWPHVQTWPPLLVDDSGGTSRLKEDSTMVFSKLPLEDFRVLSFGQGAYLMETELTLGDLPVPLRVGVLPPPGPGAVSASRAGFLEELDEREWPPRGIFLCDLGSSDATPAFGDLLDSTEYSDSRRGFGRVATLPVSLLGFPLGSLKVPGEFLLHGREIRVLQRYTEKLHAAERDLIGLAKDPNAPTRWPIRTRLLIHDLAP